jgi:hypothetical protein
MNTKREVDVLMSRENLQARVPDYTAGHDPALGLISPVFADLSGLPSLIMTGRPTSRGRRRGSAGAGHPISPSPRPLALAGREPGRPETQALQNTRSERKPVTGTRND